MFLTTIDPKLFNGKFALLAFGFLTIFFSSAVSAQSKNEVLIVADRKAECTSAAAMMKCLQVKKPQDEKWTLFYRDIENFNEVV